LVPGTQRRFAASLAVTLLLASSLLLAQRRFAPARSKKA